MKEEWKEIEGFSRYEVSTSGVVREIETGKEIPQTMNGGFLCLNLYQNSGKKTLAKVHRLVALTFIDNPLDSHIVEHKGDRLNNSIENIYWKPKQVKENKYKVTVNFLNKGYDYTDFAKLCNKDKSWVIKKLQAGWLPRECFVGFKDFTGQGFEFDSYWFPTQRELSAYVKDKKKSLKAEKENKKQSKPPRLVLGVGLNDVDEPANGPYYRRWSGMLNRGYSNKFKEKFPSYKDKYVCNEWLTFSNFKAWMEKQDWEGLELDKDILVKGNNVYSPETCCFVPGFINSCLTLSDRARGDLPLGVSRAIGNIKEPYYSKIKSDGSILKLGYFENYYSAHKAWQIAKVQELENSINTYSKMACFRTDVADALLARVWELRLEIFKGLVTYKI